MNRKFTGRDMAAILVSGFGVVIAVNFWMASLAVSTFGGVTVENSYVASQEFNRWLDRAAAERKMGLSAKLGRDGAGHLVARIDGAPRNAQVTATARHPLGRLPDRQLQFVSLGHATFASREQLPGGRWIVRLGVTSEEGEWRTQEEIR